MKLLRLLSVFILSEVILLSCHSHKNSKDIIPANPSSHPGQATHTAQILAPGIISSTLPEFATSISTDGKEIYFNRSSADGSKTRLYQSIWFMNVWNEPVPLPFSNGNYRDVDPFISQDGKRLYFSSNRPTRTTENTFNHWYVKRKGNSWSKPILLDKPLNSDSADIFITFTEGKDAYFRSERLGNRDLFFSLFKDGQYNQAQRLYTILNEDTVFASNPCISSKGDFLIVFTQSERPKADPDLFISWKMNDSWTELHNLGSKVNTSYAEFAPGLSKDDRVLFFTSDRPGMVPALADSNKRPPGDLYMIQLPQLTPGFLSHPEGEEIHFTTADGIPIVGDMYHLHPDRPIILLFHQEGSNARAEYHSIIPRLLTHRFNVLAIDLRMGGSMYGYYNRTVALHPTKTFSYCDTYSDLEATLQLVKAGGFSDVILWGSSFSAALAIQLAHRHEELIEALLVFSPSSGEPLENCKPDKYFSQIKKPLLLLRSKKEMESAKEQFSLAQSTGHQIYIAEDGVHGSSMLVKERVRGEVENHWDAVISFLEEIGN